MTPDQALSFLEGFRQLHAGKISPSKLISLKVLSDLLRAFKARAAMRGRSYPSRIKNLMRDWLPTQP